MPETMSTPEPADAIQRVKITEITVPFWSLVVLLLKIAIAGIPAAIILSILGAFGMGLLAGLASLR